MDLPLPSKPIDQRSLKRAYVEELGEEEQLLIRDKGVKHLLAVLRVRPKETLLLMDRKGMRGIGKVQSVGKGGIQVRVEKRLPPADFKGIRILVLQALLRQVSMDYVIQRLSEIGVETILPFVAERSVVRYDKENLQNKLLHWEGIGIRSYLQCDRWRPISIDSPIACVELLRSRLMEHKGPKILLNEREGRNNLKDYLKDRSISKGIECVALAVGPEGGLSQGEVDSFVSMGFVSLRVGSRILTAESAAFVASTIIQYELGDLGRIA